MTAETLRSNTHLATLLFWHSWPASAGAAKESAFYTTTPILLFPPSQPLASDRQNRQGILCLFWHYSSATLAGDSCIHWGNLISGEALADNHWNHQTRECHIPHQTYILQRQLLWVATRTVTLPMPSYFSGIRKFPEPVTLLLPSSWQEEVTINSVLLLLKFYYRFTP